MNKKLCELHNEYGKHEFPELTGPAFGDVIFTCKGCGAEMRIGDMTQWVFLNKMRAMGGRPPARLQLVNGWLCITEKDQWL